MSTLVVSNTGPLSNFLRLGRLSILESLYGKLLIPEEVAAELDRGRHILGAWRDAPGAACIDVRALAERSLYRFLRIVLDDGEAAAIGLATELGARLLLMDDLDGRNVAARQQIHLSGTLGVLRDAKQEGIIAEVRPFRTQLEHIGFRASSVLWQRVLHEVGEDDST